MFGRPHMGRVSTAESCMYRETLFLEQTPTLRAGQTQLGICAMFLSGVIN